MRGSGDNLFVFIFDAPVENGLWCGERFSSYAGAESYCRRMTEAGFHPLAFHVWPDGQLTLVTFSGVCGPGEVSFVPFVPNVKSVTDEEK